MTEPLLERLGELEGAVRRAAEAITRLRADNQRLHEETQRLREEQQRLQRDNQRLHHERRQLLVQVDGILKDLAKLDTGP
jgi:FtsZ-binding cell division protein ZapB